MAASRSRGKKRKKRRSSRIPALVLIALRVGVGGLLVVSAQNPADRGNATIDSTDPGDVAPIAPSDSGPPVTEAPITTIGSIAPPVSVDSSDDGNGDEGLVLDDFTPTETPQPPASPRTVPAGDITNGEVTGSLPDGGYLGFLEGVGSPTSIRLRFDTTTGPTLDIPLDELLFVSLRVDARDPSHPGSAVVSARTLHQLLDHGGLTYTIPDTDDLVLLDSTFLVTVADGLVVGVEAIS